MSKLIDYNSVEKEILLEIFVSVPFMDNWIANIVENYIYSNVKTYYSGGEIETEYRAKYDSIKDGEYKIGTRMDNYNHKPFLKKMK